MTKQEVKNFRGDFQNAVAQLEKQYGVNISLGTISFNSEELRAKMTATTGTASEKLTKNDFNIGDTVRINHRKCIGKIYTVVKIMKKNVLVQEEGTFGRVKVSPGLLQKA